MIWVSRRLLLGDNLLRRPVRLENRKPLAKTADVPLVRRQHEQDMRRPEGEDRGRA